MSFYLRLENSYNSNKRRKQERGKGHEGHGQSQRRDSTDRSEESAREKHPGENVLLFLVFSRIRGCLQTLKWTSTDLFLFEAKV